MRTRRISVQIGNIVIRSVIKRAVKTVGIVLSDGIFDHEHAGCPFIAAVAIIDRVVVSIKRSVEIIHGDSGRVGRIGRSRFPTIDYVVPYSISA